MVFEFIIFARSDLSGIYLRSNYQNALSLIQCSGNFSKSTGISDINSDELIRTANLLKFSFINELTKSRQWLLKK